MEGREIIIPMSVGDGLSYWFSVRKGHRKSRNIKALKSRFLKKYGKEATGYFYAVCLNPTAWKWPR